MDKFKFFRKDNYIVLVNDLTQVTQYGLVKEVMVDKSNANKASYRIFGVKDFSDKNSLVIDQLLKEDGSAYTAVEFETFYTQNTGNFNGCGTAPGIEEAPIDGLQYARQDATWSEVVGGAGGSQDLQSVLDNGNEATDKILQMWASSTGSTELRLNSQTSYVAINPGIINVGTQDGKSITINNDKIQVLNGGNSLFNFPSKIDGNLHTLATLDDIYKIPSVPIFADNATAIIGGLVVDNIYKTVTGEIRIVV